MSTTPATETDPYLLPLPSPTSPVVLPRHVNPLHAHLNAHYADHAWPLAALTENPSVSKRTVYWRRCPAVFREEIRLAAWNLINGELRPTYLRDCGTRLRSRISLGEIVSTVWEWFTLAAWLERRGIDHFADCDAGVLHDYGEQCRVSGVGLHRVYKILGALTRLWAFDQLSARPNEIGRPPWDDAGVDDYLPAATTLGGENETEPLAEQTMGLLLVWAMRVVDDLAEDILAASAARQRLIDIARTSVATEAGAAALRAYLGPLVAAQAPLPATVYRNKIVLARRYIGGITGASANQIQKFSLREGLVAAVAQRPGPCPLDVAVSGRIAGTPWRSVIDFNEAPALMRHLTTAAFIVCAFLTGARPGEILGMRSGCCPDPEPDANGKIGRHLIRSTVFKTAVNEHGNHKSSGVERDMPWVAIRPVVNAIRVLERMVPTGALLFDHGVHDTMSRPGTGSLKTATLGGRIEAFVAWANAEAATHALPSEVIPADPNGAIGTARFRRSLAWHVARRPNGLVALAIQYGHLRTTV